MGSLVLIGGCNAVTGYSNIVEIFNFTNYLPPTVVVTSAAHTTQAQTTQAQTTFAQTTKAVTTMAVTTEAVTTSKYQKIV